LWGEGVSVMMRRLAASVDNKNNQKRWGGIQDPGDSHRGEIKRAKQKLNKGIRPGFVAKR